MITETNAVTLSQNLGELLNQVQYRRDSIVIIEDGKPIAALVHARLFELICGMQERFDALPDRIARAYAEVPATEGMGEIEAAVAAVRMESSHAAKANAGAQDAPITFPSNLAPGTRP
jgi:prevent-host-death family protein